ncbi:MAG: flagellar motor switch protein FliG [Chitinivibrionales bacterium]|nr:flagellar motor switch protein FliG [Chitinivibrionales bacterium]MBD3397010.1 flagellar motor switch protein FliG [Chitinivibrionales bacterium]
MPDQKTQQDKGFYKGAYNQQGKSSGSKVNVEGVPGPKKAAIVMVALGTAASSEIFKNLDEHEVERLTTEIARLDNVSSEVREAVLEEFHNLALAQQFISQGGLDYAREILESALGPRKAKEILDKVQQSIRTTGFNLLENVDPKQLVNFIQKEHPQTIALLLAHMEPANAAPIISALPQELQVDVATRIATMESISPETLDQVEEVLVGQVKSLFGGDVSEIGGVKAVAEMLNSVDRGAEKNILGNLERENPELATEIKNLMFVFEDVLLLDDRSMQRVLKEVDTKELSMALKGASEELQEKFFRNMSSRAAEMIKEEMEYMGPIRLKDVEEVQQRVVDVIRRLEEDGEIIISGRGGEEEIVV